MSGAPTGAGGWRRDCVRWAFRLAELTALAGYDVLLDGAPLRLLLTHKVHYTNHLTHENYVT